MLELGSIRLGRAPTLPPNTALMDTKGDLRRWKQRIGRQRHNPVVHGVAERRLHRHKHEEGGGPRRHTRNALAIHT